MTDITIIDENSTRSEIHISGKHDNLYKLIEAIDKANESGQKEDLYALTARQNTANTSNQRAGILTNPLAIYTVGSRPIVLLEDSDVTVNVGFETINTTAGHIGEKSAITLEENSTLTFNGTVTNETTNISYDPTSTVFQGFNQESYYGSGLGITAKSGSTFNWESGTISSSAGIEFQKGSILKIKSRNCIFFNTDPSNLVDTNDDGSLIDEKGGETHQLRIECNFDDIEIHGVTYAGNRNSAARLHLRHGARIFQDIVMQNAIIHPSGQLEYQQPIEIHGLSIKENVHEHDIVFNATKKSFLIRDLSQPVIVHGCDKVMSVTVQDDYYCYGFLQCTQPIKGKVTNKQDEPIPNTIRRIAMIDPRTQTELSYRNISFFTRTHRSHNNVVIKDTPLLHEDTSDENGNFTEKKITTTFDFIDSGKGTQSLRRYRYCDQSDPSIINKIIEHYYAYGKQIFEQVQSYAYAGTLDSHIALKEDTNITEKDQSIVAQYQGIDIDYENKLITISQEDRTLNQLLDYIHYDKITNNRPLPTLTTYIYTVKENVIDILSQDWSIVVSGVILTEGTFYKLACVTATTLNSGKILTPILDRASKGRIQVSISNLAEEDHIFISEIDEDQNFVAEYDHTKVAPEETSIFINNEYQKTIHAKIKIFSDYYLESTVQKVLTEGLNTINIKRQKAGGVIETTGTIREIDGTINNPNGIVSVNSIEKTITFHLPVSTDIGFNILNREWNNIICTKTTPLGLDIPFTIEARQGIIINSDWTVQGTQYLSGEGFVHKAEDGEIVKAFLGIKTLNNTSSITYEFSHNQISQGKVIEQEGEIDKLVEIDTTAPSIELKTWIKNADEYFVYKAFAVKTQTGLYLRGIVLGDTNYKQIKDPLVTQILPESPAQYHYSHAQTVATDDSNTEHTFQTVIFISDDVRSLEDAINQIASVCANNDFFTSKPYTKNAENGITINEGTLIKHIGGQNLAGVISGLIKMSSSIGEFELEKQRRISISLPEGYRGNQVSFTLVKANSFGKANIEPEVIIDSSGNEISGTLSPTNKTLTVAIKSVEDLEVFLISSGLNIESNIQSSTVVLEGVSIELKAFNETVQLYLDETQTSDNTISGTRKWNPDTNDIKFNWSERTIIIPNQIIDLDFAIVYRAWKNKVIAQPHLLKYGVPITGINPVQEYMSNKTHLYNPLFQIHSNWTCDIEPNRINNPDNILTVSCGSLTRNDTQFNDNYEFNIPLANNGITPAYRFITSQNAVATTDLTQKVSTLITTTDKNKSLLINIKSEL